MVFAAAFQYRWRTAVLVKTRGKGANVTEQQMTRASIQILAVVFDRNCRICSTFCRTDLQYQGTTGLWGV